ncbi:MAG: phosphatase PAP2 family protein [Pseudomonadota bacterium]|nr:phosphatase PAP2 family protein [Pseudomonadota bacterium]MDE3037178.1 phosphatase PAP2 family protein [Pseudomonadota bacterium]
MMIPGKEVWYDWGGLNVWLFTLINAVHGDFYDQAMLVLTRAADYHNFPYYFTGLFCLATVLLIIRSARKQGGTGAHATIWFGVFAMLAAGFGLTTVVVKTSKAHFAYPRPYIALEHVRVPDYQAGKTDDHHSFPSGHTAFATLMVISLWPVIPGELGFAGILFIAGVAWSRVALGMHFPADVLASIIVMTPLLLILRAILYSLLLRIFGMRC